MGISRSLTGSPLDKKESQRKKTFCSVLAFWKVNQKLLFFSSLNPPGTKNLFDVTRGDLTLTKIVFNYSLIEFKFAS